MVVDFFCSLSQRFPSVEFSHWYLVSIGVAEAAPRFIKAKPANCLLAEFAEAGMKFSLTFWIPDPDGMDHVKSEVMLALWDAFKRTGIRPPYPVREIRIRGAPPADIAAPAS